MSTRKAVDTSLFAVLPFYFSIKRPQVHTDLFIKLYTRPMWFQLDYCTIANGVCFASALCRYVHSRCWDDSAPRLAFRRRLSVGNTRYIYLHSRHWRQLIFKEG